MKFAITTVLGGRLVACLLALLFSSAAIAESTLETSQVEKWVAAMPDMQAWGMKNQTVLQAHQNQDNLVPQNAAEMVKPIRDAGLYDEADALVQKHGFASPEEFSDVSLKVMAAYASIKMAGSGPESLEAMRKELESSKVQIETAPIPEAQKSALKQQMAQAEAMYKRVANVPEGDKAAVEPYLAKIEAASGS